MTLDVARLIGAVSRSVSTVDRDGKPARVIVAERTYDTSREDLWDALTSAERIPRWFLPISGELRLGGRYQLQGNAGGTITTCDAPQRLGLTWEMRGETSWVEVHLTAVGPERTHLRLEHTAHVPPELWDQFGPGAVGVGWEGGLLGLDQHFSKNASVDPTTAEAWMATAEGREFTRLSSDAWCAASIAAGTDPEAAKAAAARTLAFYTPPEANAPAT